MTSALAASLDSLAIDRSVERSLDAFLSLFETWNRSINLSAASTRAQLEEHVLDSLQVVPHLRGLSLDQGRGARVLDVGSGGGFPVVVAAISLPEVSFSALEPVHKKHAFLRTAVRELGLSNLDPIAERVEDHEMHEYDAAMSRATFDLVEWLRLGTSFVKPSGIVLGFEAVPRSDLPDTSERHPYPLGTKSRAIVILRERSR